MLFMLVSVGVIRAGSLNVVQYGLSSNETRQMVIPGAAYSGSAYLYRDNIASYFDLEVDENGLWLIFKYSGKAHLSVAQLDTRLMVPLRVWNLTRLRSRSIGNAWIACGILYTIASTRAHNSSVLAAYDLYRRQYARVNLPWLNPYDNANMLSYNPIDRKVYVYDNGHLITVPLLLTFDIDQYVVVD